jgi:hypothetical protein
LLVAINQHNNDISLRKIPCYRPGKNQIDPSEAEKLCDVAYYWTGDSDFAREAAIINPSLGSNGARHGHRAVVQGDDDFVVLLGLNSWVVWCFDKGFKVPGRESDPNPPSSVVHASSSWNGG